jgi:tRNA nucleotidyltransferase/poly(A) polymerase
LRSIFATQGLQLVLDSLPHARLVGGAVRDTLARRPVTDIDLATPDRPDEVMQALKQARIASIPTGLAHGTITAVSKTRHAVTSRSMPCSWIGRARSSIISTAAVI